MSQVGAMGDCGCGYGMWVCNPHSTHTCDMGLTGLDGPSGIFQSVWLSHTQPHNTLGVVFSYHHLHHPSPISLPTAANCPHTPPLSRGMWAGLFLLDWGVWQEEHKGGPSKWEAQLVCRENRPWLMAHSHLSLFPGPQLMPLPPLATLAVLTQPCTPCYKHDQNQPTLCHGKHDDHPNVKPRLANTTLGLWLTTHENTHETTRSPIKLTIYPQQPSAQDQWLSNPRKAAQQCPLTLALPLRGSLVISEGITPCGLGYPWVFVNPWPVPTKTHASGCRYGFWWVWVQVTLENPRVAHDIP